jgi:glucan phosphorylase
MLTAQGKVRAEYAPSGSDPLPGQRHHPLSDRQFERFSAFIYQTVGIKMPPAKKTMLEARLQKRLKALGMTDFDAYAAAQREVDAIWTDEKSWHAKAIRNTARMGWFSSDRTIREYARDIWNVPAA